ncbi:MAG: hypothetical protein FWH48_08110 [Oscillospiraceae bacterium]|nr:hypothetical protein [Oscillospiraceae bacterium]
MAKKAFALAALVLLAAWCVGCVSSKIEQMIEPQITEGPTSAETHESTGLSESTEFSGDADSAKESEADPPQETVPKTQIVEPDDFDIDQGETAHETTSAENTEMLESEATQTLLPDNLAEFINKNLDVILPDDFTVASFELIDAHPDEFAEIVKLGEASLPYLDEIIENSRGSRMLMAMYVQYTIRPELYDLVFLSPDGKYAVKASLVLSYFFWPQEIRHYDDIKIIECSTGSVIAASDIVTRNIEVEWSPDNRYAALSHGISGYFRETAIIDVPGADFIFLPDAQEVKQLIAEKATPEQIDLLNYLERYIFVLEKWVAGDEAKIAIAFSFTAHAFRKVLLGRYIYDLSKKEVTSIEVATDDFGNNTEILTP